jgi:hypothetical protein
MKLFIIAIVLMVVGCVVTPTTSEEVSATVSKTIDQYSGVTTFRSRPMSVDNVGSWFNAGFALASLSTEYKKDATRTYIFIYYNSQSWSFLDSASDLTQREFSVTQID